MAEDDRESVQESANDRRSERTDTVENILATVREDLGDQKYPVSSEELSAYYANGPRDVANETEWIESAFDRIDNSFEDAQEAYEALVTEFEQGDHLDIRSDAIGHEPPYESAERASTQEPGEDPGEELADDLGYDDGIDDARRRASEAQAEVEGESDESDGEGGS